MTEDAADARGLGDMCGLWESREMEEPSGCGNSGRARESASVTTDTSIPRKHGIMLNLLD